MEKFTEELYANMMAQLQQISQMEDHEFQKAEHSFHTVETTMLKLRQFVVDYKFVDQEEEIHFFKHIKPKFHSELVYLAELVHIESNKPFGSRELVTSFYRQVIQRLQIYFERRQMHYLYYRSSRTAEDKLLFLRETDCVPIAAEDYVDRDPNFSTLGSTCFAKFIGFEKMIQYLLQQIDNMDRSGSEKADERKSKAIWTDSKAALVELAYALYSRGSINHGKTDIKDIMSELEFLFHVRLGNFYRTYLDMSIRKKSRTPYIDSLKESLERRMDEGLE